jgi:TRAP-type uncharacterized transport system substrate-binding protein
MSISQKIGIVRLQAYFSEVFGLGPAATLSIVFLAAMVFGFAVFWFFHAAPPETLVITAGPEGSQFHSNAARFKRDLAKNGVKLEILTSTGALHNLQRLADSSNAVDIAFVISGTTRGTNYRMGNRSPTNYPDLVSLGSLYVEPIQIYYNDAETEFISGFAGRRIAVGIPGSGTHRTAMTLLAANGIEDDAKTDFLLFEGEDAANALLSNTVDVAFLMGDSASSRTMRRLRNDKGIRLYHFSQADAYVRRNSFLYRLEVPQGTWDFGKNIPSRDLSLVGPSVDLVARKTLHPALSDLLLESAKNLYGGPGIYRKRGEFPAPIEGDFHVSRDAADYYKSGKSFLYRSLPFWLASMINRILIGIVPIIVVLIPGIRLIPALFKLRIELRIQRWYRAIMELEKDMVKHPAPESRPLYLERLGQIERAVDLLKMPASFAGQFYNLRQHITFVRRRLENPGAPA